MDRTLWEDELPLVNVSGIQLRLITWGYREVYGYRVLVSTGHPFQPGARFNRVPASTGFPF